MSVDYLSRAVKGVQGLTPYVPGKPIEELERELGLKDIIKLASNENPLGPSKKAIDAARSALSELGRYPDGNGFALKQALSAKLEIEIGRIVLGNGSNDLLDMVARCFLGPGRNAVFSEYAFAVYPISTQASGAEARVAPANAADHPEQPLGHDLEAMLKRINDGTGVVFIANPNNPTGSWLNAADIEAFLGEVPSEIVVVLDEAYYEYMRPELRPNSRKLLDKHENLVVTRTFSKVHGLASLRVGYAVCSEQIANLLNRVRQPFNNNGLALPAAIASLSDDEHLRHSVKLNEEGMIWLKLQLESLGLKVLPSQGNFLTMGFGRDAADINQALLQSGVIVRPLASYGMPNYLRVTVGTMRENERFLAALKAILTND